MYLDLYFNRTMVVGVDTLESCDQMKTSKLGQQYYSYLDDRAIWWLCEEFNERKILILKMNNSIFLKTRN